MSLERKSRFLPRYREFLRRLRQARVVAGFRQVEVATLLNRPQSYVSKCESGERLVDVVDLWEFARLYGVPVADFFEDAELPVQADEGRARSSAGKALKRAAYRPREWNR